MSQTLSRIEGSAGARRHFRYFDYVMAAFVTILLLSNLIGAGKRAVLDLPFVGPWPFGAGVLFFPISYIIGDVLTEVYGYAHARRCIWVGFWAMLFMVFMSVVVVALPPDAGWTGQAAYESVFGQTPRIVFASVVAFWAGEFVNSFVLAKMKIVTAGRWLWARTIGSTIAGEGIDSMIFYPLAFWNSGIMPNELVPVLMLSQFVAKVGVEVFFTPLTYVIVNFLKRHEKEDWYDRDTEFNPFSVKLDR